MKNLRFILLVLIGTLIFSISTPIYSSSLNFILNKEVNYDIPKESSQIYNMPWVNNEDFLEAKDKYDTPILMAGFSAVLLDPLPGEEYNVALAAESINGQVVGPSKLFSQNDRIGPYTKKRGYKDGTSFAGGSIVTTEGGGICKISTSLYNLAVLSNLEIVERHYHSMPINYVAYGQDATVAYGIKDFGFKNTTDGNILIWSELIGKRLYMGFYGSERPPKVTWSHEVTNIVKPSLKYIRNEMLGEGDMVLKIKGLDGADVKSIVTIEYDDGAVETKKMPPSHYKPLPEVFEMN